MYETELLFWTVLLLFNEHVFKSYVNKMDTLVKVAKEEKKKQTRGTQAHSSHSDLTAIIGLNSCDGLNKLDSSAAYVAH